MTANLEFNFEAGQRQKIRGMDKAAKRTPLALRQARLIARQLAHENGTVTADDVAERLDSVDHDNLGNAAGSIFKGKEWLFVAWVPSRRTSNHGRHIRQWALKP